MDGEVRLDAGYWILDDGYWMMDTGCWILDVGCWILDAGCWILVFWLACGLVFLMTNDQ